MEQRVLFPCPDRGMSYGILWSIGNMRIWSGSRPALFPVLEGGETRLSVFTPKKGLSPLKKGRYPLKNTLQNRAVYHTPKPRINTGTAGIFKGQKTPK
ncbi:hypothetical protein DXA96_14465 [Lachnospiraceae bacterium OF09-33XD]|nr:hypothetical protein DXA96_14465 [Lachnospiraceae bacterium OF09-33XD]